MSLRDNRLSWKIRTITKHLETTLIIILQSVIYSAGQLHESIDMFYSSTLLVYGASCVCQCGFVLLFRNLLQGHDENVTKDALSKTYHTVIRQGLA
jgi:hypothetical protein